MLRRLLATHAIRKQIISDAISAGILRGMVRAAPTRR